MFGLVFFEGRLLGGLLGIDGNVNATMATIWSCLALSMLFAELANNFYDIKVNLRAPASVRSEARGDAGAFRQLVTRSGQHLADTPADK
jgi:hypothetical protein